MIIFLEYFGYLLDRQSLLKNDESSEGKLVDRLSIPTWRRHDASIKPSSCPHLNVHSIAVPFMRLVRCHSSSDSNNPGNNWTRFPSQITIFKHRYYIDKVVFGEFVIDRVLGPLRIEGTCRRFSTTDSSPSEACSALTFSVSFLPQHQDL